MASRLLAAYGASGGRLMCAASAFPRASLWYVSRRDTQEALRLRLRDLAGAWSRHDGRHLHVLLRREGWEVNHKWTYRLYAEGLAMQSKTQHRHVSSQFRRPAASGRWTS